MKHWSHFAIIALLVNLPALPALHAQEKILMSYGGHNETVGPMWVGVEKGLFRKHGLEKRAGLRSLINTSELKVPYQGVGICTRSDRLANSPDLMLRMVKGMVDALVFIHDPRNKREVMEVLKKNLRLTTDQDAETSYNALRLVSTLDIAPDPEAWKNTQRFVSRVTPKVAQLDVGQIINISFVKNLEETGYLPEARKKLGL